MKSIKTKYGLCNISGDTTISTNGNPGLIWAPYILMQSPVTIISDGNVKYWRRLKEVEKRSQKIQKIMDRINGTICN